jgi:F0F1-type ATP synthase assembly protein I
VHALPAGMLILMLLGMNIGVAMVASSALYLMVREYLT